MGARTSRRLAVVEARMDEQRRALRVQAKEYSRRLEELNHAQQRAIGVQREFLPRELYLESQRRFEQTEAELRQAVATKAGEDQAFRDHVTEQLSTLAGRDRGIGLVLGGAATIAVVAAGLGALVVKLGAG